MREKINSLQGLRVIAMLIIFLYHAELFPFGHFAVTFFFILSGFVAYYSNTSKDTLSLKGSIVYSLKKIKKFYPIYFLTVILAVVLKFDILKSYSLKKILQIIFCNITLTQAFIPSSDFYFGLNGVGWYLSALLFCYLLFNSYKFAINKIGLNIKFLLPFLLMFQFLVAYITKDLPYEFTQWFIYINPIMRSINFLMGMILAKLFCTEKFLTDKYNKIYTRIELFILFIFLSIYVLSIFIPRSFIWSSYYSPIILIVIYVFAFEKGVVSRFLGNKKIIGLSKISFEFYIIHQLIINIIWRLFSNNKMIIASISFVITLGLSIILSKTINIHSFNKTNIAQAK